MTAHPFADCCPRCLSEDSEPIAPHTVQELDLPHVRAIYRCPSCGHGWFTGWNSEFVIGRPESAGGAA